MVNQSPIVLFDGVCNYCNSIVDRIIRRDRKGTIKFAALQSAAGQRILREWNLPTQNFDTFIFIDQGKAYQRSNAALRLYGKFPWYWKWTQLFWIFPRFIRDGIYRWIANNRFRWFGKREECRVPTPELRERFIES